MVFNLNLYMYACCVYIINNYIVCTPLAVETDGCWGADALAYIFLSLPHASQLDTTSSLYGRLNLVLVTANARALLSRTYGISSDITV